MKLSCEHTLIRQIDVRLMSNIEYIFANQGTEITFVHRDNLRTYKVKINKTGRWLADALPPLSELRS